MPFSRIQVRIAAAIATISNPITTAGSLRAGDVAVMNIRRPGDVITVEG